PIGSILSDVYFFFSSRRRHTRSTRDWSSDVCSSDLCRSLRLLDMPQTLRRIAGVLSDLHAKHRFLTDSLGRGYSAGAADRLIERSEERRVGKECGSAWWRGA